MKTTENAYADFMDGIAFSEIDSEKDLSFFGYQDPFVTLQQKKRDVQITELLTEYVKSYKQKVKHSSICRYIILIPCMLIICFFAGILIYFSIQMLNSQSQIEVPDVVSFATACISFITLIIGLLTIITKYFFPENDEQYITAIVEAIQKNDLENKRENAKYEQKEPNSPNE